MSTNASCVFIELARDRWYYLLEAPHTHAMDWREQAYFHGPFSSDDMAQEHLRQSYPNPGGHTILALAPGEEAYDLAADPVLARKLSEH